MFKWSYMKKMIAYISFIGLAFVLFTNRAWAQMGMMGDFDTNQTAQDSDHTESLETVLKDLLSQQGVDKIQSLDCSKLTDEQLETLGDSVMEQNHPGQAHEAMDQMMGGEGSESLKQMHINMGRGYLGCGVNGSTNYYPGFMGGMMGYGRGWYGYGALDEAVKIAAIVFLAAGTYFFIRKAGKK